MQAVVVSRIRSRAVRNVATSRRLQARHAGSRRPSSHTVGTQYSQLLSQESVRDGSDRLWEYERPDQRNFFATTTTTSIQSRSMSTTGINDDKDWKEQLEKYISSDDALQAQEILDLIEGSAITVEAEELCEARFAVLDAWISYQDECLEAYDTDEPDRIQLAAICTAAESAHDILERIHPSLARTNAVGGNVFGDAKSAVGIELSEEEDASRRRRKPFNDKVTKSCDAVLTAWARANRAGHGFMTRITRGIPQRAQFLLEQMEATYADPDSTADSAIRPTVESYNKVVEAWGYSDEHLRGNMAERIFSKLSQGNISGVGPDAESYRLIIWAWALSRDGRAAFTATGHLMKMLRRLENDENMEPSLEDYHVVLKAWVRADDKMSPGKALSVIRIMKLSYDKEITQVQADTACYRYVLMTAAQRPAIPDLGPMVDDMFTTMKERFLAPDRECYGAAVRTWKNAALDPEETEFRENCVKRTLELLSEMNVAHNRSASVSVQPLTENVNDAIEALSVSMNFRRTDQAEALLKNMEQSLTAASTLSFPRPNVDSYRLVIDVWASTDASDKAARGRDVLESMLKHYDTVIEPMAKKDAVVATFNSFVRLCAFVRVPDEDEGMSVIRSALTAIERMRTIEGASPNALTYAGLLECCERLLPLGRERAGLVEKIFRLCCGDGMVDDNVLLMLRSAATSDQYDRMVVSRSEKVEGTKMVPEEWTLNALGKRVVTADGRKGVPLSIDGRLTVTLAMQDFKMRRLIDKRNRNTLQGGRLAKPTITRSTIQ